VFNYIKSKNPKKNMYWIASEIAEATGFPELQFVGKGQ
jgi:hypothetical protein